MTEAIKKVIQEGNGNAIIFTALAAGAIANTLPTPMDAVYFRRQQKLKQDLEEGKISIEKFWLHDSAEYYLWTSLWYVLLIGVLMAFGGEYKKNIRLLIVATSAGLVFAAIQKNIQKDKQFLSIKNSQKNNQSQ